MLQEAHLVWGPVRHTVGTRKWGSLLGAGAAKARRGVSGEHAPTFSPDTPVRAFAFAFQAEELLSSAGRIAHRARSLKLLQGCELCLLYDGCRCRRTSLCPRGEGKPFMDEEGILNEQSPYIDG